MLHEEISGTVIDAAMRVHSALGPGLLERAYQVCLLHELKKRGIRARGQVRVPIVYDGIRINVGYKIDILVEECVVVELKVVGSVLPVHHAQVLSYLKLSGHRVGLLLNFHVARMKDGIVRFVN